MVIAACIAIAAGGAILWHKVVRHYFIVRNFGVVEPHQVYRAGRFLPSLVDDLKTDYGIRTIIDLGAYPPGSAEDRAEQEAAAEHGIARHSFSLAGDGTGDPNQYVQALRLMADPARQPVLVHCATGAQRTTAAVLLYRHLIQGRDLMDAYPESFNYKHDPGDNWKLMTYLAENMALIEESWRTGRPIVSDGQGRWRLADAALAASAQAAEPGAGRTGSAP
jgi:protein tyrosine/serine phosphatase